MRSPINSFPMSDSTLAFYLDAPMQSWGASSRFQRRETETYPTKSAVLGLVAAALGIDKHSADETQRLSPLVALRFSVLKVPHEAHLKIQLLRDFHTVGGGWIDDWKEDKSNILAKLQVPAKAGDSSPFGTVITQRTYLTDAKFIALLEGSQSLLTECAAALENPRWGIWLGRKCCIPATPLTPTLAATREQAIAALAAKLGWAEFQPAQCEGQHEGSGDGAWFPLDQPVSFGKRIFQTRPVSRTFPGA